MGVTHTFGRYALRLGAVATALGALSGCQSIDVNSSNAAEVRFFNASPDPTLPGMDFYLGTTGLVYNLGFGTTTTYSLVSPGNTTISADSHNTTSALVSSSATLGSGHAYTAIVSNVAANLTETVLQDQNTPAPTGEIAVRFLDEATKVGAVDVYLVPSGGKLTTTNPIVTNINLLTNTGYVNVPSGTYSIAVVPTGTVPVSTTVTLVTGPQVGYAAGAVRTVVLIDTQVTTTPGVSAVVLDDYDSPTAG